jgi:aerobic C4-dicarboxylate transport protein
LGGSAPPAHFGIARSGRIASVSAAPRRSIISFGTTSPAPCSIVEIREKPFPIATTSTESVLPRMMEKMENVGCAKPVVGLALPAGYTFNPDGTCIFLTMAAIFIARATNTPLTIGDQFVVLAVLMLMSKGSAGVAGAGFVTLAATLASLDRIPVAGLVLLLGVDRFINEARAVTNLIGNGIATIAVARWDRAFDARRAAAVLDQK